MEEIEETKKVRCFSPSLQSSSAVDEVTFWKSSSHFFVLRKALRHHPVGIVACPARSDSEELARHPGLPWHHLPLRPTRNYFQVSSSFDLSWVFARAVPFNSKRMIWFWYRQLPRPCKQAYLLMRSTSLQAIFRARASKSCRIASCACGMSSQP